VLAFGELLSGPRAFRFEPASHPPTYLASDGWLTPGGRSFAAAYLLPRAEAALLPELQRLASAVTAAGQ
jgi:hypothetical protein